VVLKPEAARKGQAAQVTRMLDRFGRVVTLRPGQYAVFVRREGVGAAVDAVLQGLEGLLDDFRLAPPSLEDVYIHLAGQKLESEE
jgi:hypothetical protein